MATVRATCPDCGDIETSTRNVAVLRCSSTGSVAYSLVCPGCHSRVARSTTEHVVGLLVGAGVPVRTWEMPAELDEPKAGLPVTHDDLLAFHCSLEQPGWLEAEVSAMRRSSHPSLG